MSKYLEETAAAPLSRRQMAKLFGGLIVSAVQHLDAEVVRVAWANLHQRLLGEEAAVVEGDLEQLTAEQLLHLQAFAVYSSALIGACSGFCRREDIKAASAFYAEQDGPWELLKKEKN